MLLVLRVSTLVSEGSPTSAIGVTCNEMFENLTNKLENIFSKLKKAPSLTEDQVDSALKEIFRVLKSNHYALLAPATKPDLTGYFHLTVESKEWWVEQCEKIGFLFIAPNDVIIP